MDHFDAYIFLFNDSFITSLILNARLSYATDVMLMLGNYESLLIFIITFAASILGLVINWIFGTFIRKLEKLERFSDRVDALSKGEIFFRQKGKWILLLSAVPFWGALFTTAAGVMRFNFIQFLALVSISKFIALFIKVYL